MNRAMYKTTATPATELLTAEQAKERYNLSRDTIEKRAQECGAALKIGRNKRYIKSKLDNYLTSFQA